MQQAQLTLIIKGNNMGKYKDLNTREDERLNNVAIEEQIQVSFNANDKTIVISIDGRGLLLDIEEAAKVFVDIGHILQDINYITQLEKLKKELLLLCCLTNTLYLVGNVFFFVCKEVMQTFEEA